jgi:DNA-binding beta-propeller fold protein YncE/predicted Ser/Thr protein kinase
MSRADDDRRTDGLDDDASLGSLPDPRIGSELAGYRILALLGRGGTSVVYRAEQARPRRSVALKLLLPEVAASAAFRRRFLREQELAASIDHPNVLPVYDAGEAGGVLWIAMRYVEGSDLRALLAQRGPPRPWEAVAIVAQVASALDAAHARGLVHRDVKPGNVLLAGETGGVAHAYLADFGLTRQVDAPSGLTASGQMVGTVNYCAPEQVQGGPVDGRADQYALACVLFECLTGAVPFRRPTELATAWAHVHDRPPRLAEVRPGLPRAMEPVLARGLAKRPADRYATCTDLAAVAREALGGAAARGLAVRMAWQRIVRPRRRTVRLVLVLAVAVLVGALASAGLLLRSDPNANQSPTAPVVAPGTAVRIDAATGQVTAVIHVGGAPAAVATGNGLAWVADRKDATVSVIDQRTDQVQDKISLPGPIPKGPGGPAIAFQDESAWVVTSGHKSVSLVDANTKKPHPININALPSSVAVGGDTVLVAESAVGKVDIIDTIGSTPRQLKVGQAPSGVALTPNGLTGWIVDRKDQKLVKVDTQTAKVVQQIDLPLPPEQVTRSGDDVLWVTSSRSQVMRVDPRAPTPKIEPIPVGNGPTGIAYGMGKVWVADSSDTTLSFIDTDPDKNPNNSYAVATLQLGFHPTAVAVDDQTQSVWVTVSA